jgi:tripartite-type tricarboxylate transporter receptor subunit TctC
MTTMASASTFHPTAAARKLLACLAVLAVLGASLAANANESQSAPIRLVVAFGGGSEAIVRLLAPKISEALGRQPVIVEPMTTAAGTVAARTVAAAAPDGRTILVGSGNSLIFRPLVMRTPPYDTLRDFTPISQFTSGAFTLALNPALKIGTFQEFIAYARRNPDGVRIGMAGSPSVNDLNRVMLEQGIPGLKITSVPYREESLAVTDAMGGHITGVLAALSAVAPVARDGKLTAVLMFADERREPLETIPAVGEVVPGARAFRPFTGFWGPANMPQPVVDRLHAAIAAALGDKEIQARVRTLGSIAQSSTPEQLRAATVSEIQRTREMLRRVDFTPE